MRKEVILLSDNPSALQEEMFSLRWILDNKSQGVQKTDVKNIHDYFLFLFSLVLKIVCEKM